MAILLWVGQVIDVCLSVLATSPVQAQAQAWMTPYKPSMDARFGMASIGWTRRRTRSRKEQRSRRSKKETRNDDDDDHGDDDYSLFPCSTSSDEKDVKSSTSRRRLLRFYTTLSRHPYSRWFKVILLRLAASRSCFVSVFGASYLLVFFGLLRCCGYASYSSLRF